MGILLRGKNVSNIAKNIKEYRISHDMKQTEMAELLEMNYQNYSKLERGVYIPSLDKLLDICDILVITPNDLLLAGREADDLRKETFEKLDDSIVDIADTMKVVEDLRAKAVIARENGDEKLERAYLDQIIQIYVWKNEDYWELADYVYYKKLDELIRKASDKTLKAMVEENKKSRK